MVHQQDDLWTKNSGSCSLRLYLFDVRWLWVVVRTK